MYIVYGLVQQEIMLLQRQLDVMRVDNHAYPPPGTRTRASGRKPTRWSDVRHRAAHLPSLTSDAHRTWQLPRSEVPASSCTPDATVATATSRRTMTTDPSTRTTVPCPYVTTFGRAAFLPPTRCPPPLSLSHRLLLHPRTAGGRHVRRPRRAHRLR